MKKYTQVRRKIADLSHRKAESLTDSGLELLDELNELLIIAQQVGHEFEAAQVEPAQPEPSKKGVGLDMELIRKIGENLRSESELVRIETLAEISESKEEFFSLLESEGLVSPTIKEPSKSKLKDIVKNNNEMAFSKYLEPQPSAAEELLKRVLETPFAPNPPGTISKREFVVTTLEEIIRIDKK